MALFIGVHQMQGVSQKRMVSSWQRYKKMAIQRGLKPVRVHIHLKKGIGFCLTEAPTKASVVQAHQKAEVQVPGQVFEVKIFE